MSSLPNPNDFKFEMALKSLKVTAPAIAIQFIISWALPVCAKEEYNEEDTQPYEIAWTTPVCEQEDVQSEETFTISWSNAICEQSDQVTTFEHQWYSTECILGVYTFEIDWSNLICESLETLEPGQFYLLWENPICESENDEFKYEWENPECLINQLNVSVIWSLPVCGKLSKEFSFSWADRECIVNDVDAEVLWQNDVCVKNVYDSNWYSGVCSSEELIPLHIHSWTNSQCILDPETRASIELAVIDVQNSEYVDVPVYFKNINNDINSFTMKMFVVHNFMELVGIVDWADENTLPFIPEGETLDPGVISGMLTFFHHPTLHYCNIIWWNATKSIPLNSGTDSVPLFKMRFRLKQVSEATIFFYEDQSEITADDAYGISRPITPLALHGGRVRIQSIKAFDFEWESKECILIGFEASTYNFDWEDSECLLVETVINSFGWNNPQCQLIEQDTIDFSWEDSECQLISDAPSYTFNWSFRECVLKTVTLLHTWDNKECILVNQGLPTHTMSWREEECVLTPEVTITYTYTWTLRECILNV